MSETDARQQIARLFRTALSSAIDQSTAAAPDAMPLPPARSATARLSMKSPPPAKSLAFSPELVRAILDGRKIQTRRLIRPRPKTTAPSTAKCAIARPHDLLAVREPWAQIDGTYVYAADAPFGVARFRPGMYMPRDASRLTLHVTKVEAQRLQQITRDDALAEGCPSDQADPVGWFAALWDRIFTMPGDQWCDDPWVWVVHFEKQ